MTRPSPSRRLVLAAMVAAVVGLAACDDSDPTPAPSTSLGEEQRESPEGSGVGGIAPRQTDVGDQAPGTGSTP